MLAVSQDVTTGRGITVLLQGEGGIGKSRLLEELAGGLAAYSPERGEWLILQGSCSPFDDRLSYGPFVDAFQTTASGDLIDLLTESYEAAPDARGRFFWRVLQAIRSMAHNGPLLITIDELGHLERQAGYRAGLALAARGQNDAELALALLEEALAHIAGELRAEGFCRAWTGTDFDNVASQNGIALAGFRPVADLVVDRVVAMRLVWMRGRDGVPEHVVTDVRRALLGDRDRAWLSALSLAKGDQTMMDG